MTWKDIYKKLCKYAIVECSPLANDVKVILEGELHNKVIIEKGENRHPYADVLHEWIEGIVEIQYQLELSHSWNDIGNPEGQFRTDKYAYRIKPSEPVYLYQYAYSDYDGTSSISDYMTEEDAVRLLEKRTKAIKLDWTKKEGA